MSEQYSVHIATIAFDPHPPWAKIDNQVKEDHQYMISAMTEQVLGVQRAKFVSKLLPTTPYPNSEYINNRVRNLSHLRWLGGWVAPRILLSSLSPLAL